MQLAGKISLAHCHGVIVSVFAILELCAFLIGVLLFVFLALYQLHKKGSALSEGHAYLRGQRGE